ncbi:MAG: tail fiber domain-containing protein [Bacteroidota bacterium]
MKKTLLLLYVLIFIPYFLFSQNVGIGTNEPFNKLQVQGNLLVASPTTTANRAPGAAQTKTMVNASTIAFLNTDSTGIIYDPGGPAGNYLANMTANVNIPASTNTGIEVSIESIDLGTGDSLIIKEYSSATNYLLAVGNSFTTTGKWVFNSSVLYIIFKSNADAVTGAGFSLLIKRLYNNSASLQDVSGAAGNAFFVDVKNGSLRSGSINNASRGDYSNAMGLNTIASGNSSTAMGRTAAASGDYSTAMGNGTIANGDRSTALGDNTTASGTGSTAIGVSTTASGDNSTAMGLFTTASGTNSFAIGRTATASGDYSTAIGWFVNTNNYEGSFIIGDKSTNTVMTSPNENNFRARFAGGYKLFTSANLATGCTLFAGDNAWTTGSSVHTKENFSAVNGEDFLKKIAGLSLTSWNYKTQNPKTFRHYGPMAQDFYAAFGKDEYGSIGNDTTINSADFAGVSFIAIQALEKRTQKIEQLEKENEALRKMLNQLRKEVNTLIGFKKKTYKQ